jgi:hypothetical protein
MGTAIRNKIKRLSYIRDNVKKELDVVLQNHDADIVRLNYLQMIDGYGSDGKNLFNSQRQFDGVYAPGYKKQGLYDFFVTGQFKRGLFSTVKDGLITVDSTGKGSGEKSLFFAGYTNLFGLNDDSNRKLRRIIQQDIQNFINKYK